MYSAPKTVVILPTVVKTKKKEDVLTDKQQYPLKNNVSEKLTMSSSTVVTGVICIFMTDQ